MTNSMVTMGGEDFDYDRSGDEVDASDGND